MARAAIGIDYVAELLKIRDHYVSATPRQRLSVIRQRLEDHHFGPNRLVTTVSAVEAFARCLTMRKLAKRKADLVKIYSRYKGREAKSLVDEYLKSRGILDPQEYFGEDTWKLFGYAVSYRNLLTHECTYLGLDKFSSLIKACEDVLDKLEKLSAVSAK